MIGMSEDRLKHSYAVAHFASRAGENLFGWSEEKCQEIFVMGFLHDIGYEFVSDQRDHASKGGEILQRMGFKHWEEIAQHGDASASMSDELFVLNFADMCTMPDGLCCPMNYRLKDIGERYGQDSEQYIEAKKLVEVLTKRHHELLGK